MNHTRHSSTMSDVVYTGLIDAAEEMDLDEEEVISLYEMGAFADLRDMGVSEALLGSVGESIVLSGANVDASTEDDSLSRIEQQLVAAASRLDHNPDHLIALYHAGNYDELESIGIKFKGLKRLGKKVTGASRKKAWNKMAVRGLDINSPYATGPDAGPILEILHDIISQLNGKDLYRPLNDIVPAVDGLSLTPINDEISVAFETPSGSKWSSNYAAMRAYYVEQSKGGTRLLTRGDQIRIVDLGNDGPKLSMFWDTERNPRPTRLTIPKILPDSKQDSANLVLHADADNDAGKGTIGVVFAWDVQGGAEKRIITNARSLNNANGAIMLVYDHSKEDRGRVRWIIAVDVDRSRSMQRLRAQDIVATETGKKTDVAMRGQSSECHHPDMKEPTEPKKTPGLKDTPPPPPPTVVPSAPASKPPTDAPPPPMAPKAGPPKPPTDAPPPPPMPSKEEDQTASAKTGNSREAVIRAAFEKREVAILSTTDEVRFAMQMADERKRPIVLLISIATCPNCRAAKPVFYDNVATRNMSSDVPYAAILQPSTDLGIAEQWTKIDEITQAVGLTGYNKAVPVLFIYANGRFTDEPYRYMKNPWMGHYFEAAEEIQDGRRPVLFDRLASNAALPNPSRTSRFYTVGTPTIQSGVDKDTLETEQAVSPLAREDRNMLKDISEKRLQEQLWLKNENELVYNTPSTDMLTRIVMHFAEPIATACHFFKNGDLANSVLGLSARHNDRTVHLGMISHYIQRDIMAGLEDRNLTGTRKGKLSALATSIGLLQTAQLIRHTTYQLLSEQGYNEGKASYRNARKIRSSDPIPERNVASWPHHFFSTDHSDTAKLLGSDSAWYENRVGEFARKVVDITATAEPMASDKNGNNANHTIGAVQANAIFIKSSSRQLAGSDVNLYQWPRQFELVCFGLIAAGTGILKHLGITSTDHLRDLVHRVTGGNEITGQSVRDLHAAVLTAYKESATRKKAQSRPSTGVTPSAGKR